jgi:hypothetical protein
VAADKAASCVDSLYSRLSGAQRPEIEDRFDSRSIDKEREDKRLHRRGMTMRNKEKNRKDVSFLVGGKLCICICGNVARASG